MTNIVYINPDDCGTVVDNQGARLDAYGQTMLLGVFSDLCQYRDSETDKKRATELDSIVNRMGKLLERYEP